MKFSERLGAMGFASYDDYLNSPHWADFRERYKASGRPVRCAACGAPRPQLHHHDYSRLGREELDDVTPLCRGHHTAVHDWLKANGLSVRHTGKALAAVAGGSPVRSGGGWHLMADPEFRAAVLETQSRIKKGKQRKELWRCVNRNDRAGVMRLRERAVRAKPAAAAKGPPPAGFEAARVRLEGLVAAGSADATKAANVIACRDVSGVLRTVAKATGEEPPKPPRPGKKAKKGGKRPPRTGRPPSPAHLAAKSAAAAALASHRGKDANSPAAKIRRQVLRGVNVS